MIKNDGAKDQYVKLKTEKPLFKIYNFRFNKIYDSSKAQFINSNYKHIITNLLPPPKLYRLVCPSGNPHRSSHNKQPLPFKV